MRFRDRTEAGRVLAERLAPFARRPDVLVLALPRGGVPVAYKVARALEKVRLRQDLQRSLAEIQAREEQLRKAHNELEQQVEERTAALAQANAALVEQMAERQRIEDELLKVRRSISHSL